MPSPPPLPQADQFGDHAESDVVAFLREDAGEGVILIGVLPPKVIASGCGTSGCTSSLVS